MIVKRQCEIRFLADAISVEGRVFNLPSECTLVRESDYDLLAAELAEAKKDAERFASYADALAHQMLYKDSSNLLKAWWTLRGGIDKCTICNPALAAP